MMDKYEATKEVLRVMHDIMCNDLFKQSQADPDKLIYHLTAKGSTRNGAVAIGHLLLLNAMIIAHSMSHDEHEKEVAKEAFARLIEERV